MPFTISIRPPAINGVRRRRIRSQGRRNRPVGFHLPTIDPKRQQQVAQRDAARVEGHVARAAARRLHRGLYQPRARRILRAELEIELAGMRARKAQMDALELRLMAVAQVVDDQVAALRPISVSSPPSRPSAPRLSSQPRRPRSSLRAALVAAARGVHGRHRRRARRHRSEGRCQGPLLRAGRNRSTLPRIRRGCRARHRRD